MIENATAKVYQPTLAPNDRGTLVKTWGYKLVVPTAANETIRVDSQPKGLTQVQIQEWGLDTRASQARALYFDHSSFILIGNRVHLTHDYDSSSNGYYEIKAVNPWPIHKEAILVPVQGG